MTTPEPLSPTNLENVRAAIRMVTVSMGPDDVDEAVRAVGLDSGRLIAGLIHLVRIQLSAVAELKDMTREAVLQLLASELASLDEGT